MHYQTMAFLFQEMSSNDCFIFTGKKHDEMDGSPVEMKPLPSDYILAINDVICGRGKKCFKHAGNENFRKILQENLKSYALAQTKTEKTFIIHELINTVHEMTPRGRFVKHDPMTGRYFEVGDAIAVRKLFELSV
jgi:hypothetical protein